mgnify:FL=1
MVHKGKQEVRPDSPIDSPSDKDSAKLKDKKPPKKNDKAKRQDSEEANVDFDNEISKIDAELKKYKEQSLKSKKSKDNAK